jgi:hypothetical protein
MSRCKACDSLFAPSQFTPVHRRDSELCSYCRFVADNPYYVDCHEYQFEAITENPTYLENYKHTCAE